MTDWAAAVADYDAGQQNGKPASGGPAGPAPPPAPASSPWADAIAEMDANALSAAQAANYSAHATTPDAAAKALTIQRQTGIPATVAEANMPEAERRASLAQTNASLAADPALTGWLAANPAAARVARDDYDKLSVIGKTARSLSSGWQAGQLGYERGNIGNTMQAGLDTLDTRARLQQVDQALQQDQAADPGGVQGFLRGASSFASSTLDNLLVGAATGAAAAGVGAAAGAATGAAAGGAGAVPGAVAGAVGGLSYGFGTGFLADMARNTAGNAYVTASQAVDRNGQPLDEWTKQGAAFLTGIGTYVLGGVGAGAAGNAMSKLFGAAIQDAVTRPTVAAAVGTFAREVAKGAGTGAAINGGMELSSIFAQQAARVLSSGDFPTVFDDPAQRQQAVQQLVTSLVDGAELFGALHALPGVRGLGGDLARVRQSRADVAGFQALEAGAADNATRARAPSVFLDWLQRQTEGTPAENLFIPGEAIRSLYQEAGAEPGPNDGVLGQAVPDIRQQLDQAAATGGDVVVPTAAYVTHLAGTDLSKRLQPDIRVRQDGLSAREAEAFNDEARQAGADRGRDLDAQHAIEEAQRGPVQTIHDDVFSQARQAGFSPDVAEQYAALLAARYATRGERLGENPLGLYQGENLRIRQDLPETLQTAPADALDALIASVRSNRSGPAERDLYGPSLMEFLARRGGVEDAGGDLKAMGADAWHRDKPGVPRLVRQADRRGAALPGMGAERGSRFSEDAAALAAHEAGYLPGGERPTIADLHEAIRREMAGDRVYSDQNVNSRAVEFEQARRDLVEALDRLGIDPKTASNAEIRQALAGELGGDAAKALRSFDQTGKAMARIRSDEIAPADADAKTLRKAATAWFRENLRGTSVHNPVLGDVQFVNKGIEKAVHSSTNPLKLRLVRALPEIIKNGDYEGSIENSDLTRKPHVAAYHSIVGTVELDGVPHRVRVLVEEHRDGNFYYNHTMPDLPSLRSFQQKSESAQVGGPRRPGVSPSAERDGTDGLGATGDIGRRPSGADVAPAADGFNLDVRRFEQPASEGARGRIDFTETGAVIRLFARRNLSTLLHESGHLWLDELVRDVQHPDAPEQLRQDFNSVLKWLGANSGEALTTEQHEQWARGVEAYLMEGKAPSPALAAVFARFKSWLVAIYRSVAGLRVGLSPEVRQVMDRLIATDREIEAAQRQAQVQLLFKSAGDAVMTDKEFAAYERAAEAAKDEAHRTLLDKAMGDIRRERTATWKAEAAKVRDDEVIPQVDARPDMQAMELLRRGRPRGSEADPVSMRLSRAALEEMFGPGVTDALPRSVPPIWTERGGMHPDGMAEMVGLRSGDELVRRLMTLGERQRQLRETGDRRSVRQESIDRETQALMEERHGALLDENGIADEAAAAVHNDLQLKAMGIELQALGRRFREAPRGNDELRAIRSWAARTIGEKRVADATATHLYARAEAKAAKAAFDAVEKGRPEEAYRQQRARMLNHTLFIEAKRAGEDAEAIRKRLGRYADARSLRSMDQDALEQIHDLLERSDFRQASQRTVERRQGLAEWVQSQRDKGLEPAVPDRLLNDAFRQHYSRMTIDDLRGLDDAVQSIAHLGRLKQKLLDAKEEREFDAIVQEAVQTAGKLPQLEPESRRNPGSGGTGLDRLKAKVGTIKSAFRMADASLLKMEQVFEWLDGKDSNGVFNRVVFRRLSDAQVREHDLQAEYAAKLRALSGSLPKQRRAELDRIRSVSELPDGRTGEPSAMTKGELLAVALNTGNEGNLGKMLRGEGWSVEQVRAALDNHLSHDDWRFVQGVWDTIEGLWPEIAALEKRMSGVEPEKVERTPVETRYGTFEGGYYPLVYDPLRSFDVEQNRQRGGSALFENNYTRATTGKGHTIERVDTYARPLLLSLDVLPRHLNGVIHDVAYREAVMDADRFLAEPRVREAIEGAMGREIYQQFRPWLQSIANDRAIDPRGMAFWDRLAHKARTNTTMVGLGFRLSTMVVHGTSAALNSVGEVGAGPMGRAVGAFMKDPRGMRDFVFERSGEMRNRMNDMDRDMRDALRDLHGDHGPLATVRRFSMMGVAMLDMASALPTWVAAHTEALKAGMDEGQAGYAADQAVRNAHGAGGAKDLSRIQRGSETQKLFTMFYSFWNHLYNRQRDLLRDAGHIRSIGDFGSVLARSFFYLVAPPVIHGLIAGGRGAGDEDESWAHWAAEHIALGLVSGVPVARDIASAVAHGTEYRMSPAADVIIKGGHAAKDAAHALGLIEGEPSDRWVRHAIETPGYFLGLPTGQAAGAGQFLWDAWNGDEDPRSTGEWLRGIMYGPAPKGATR